MDRIDSNPLGKVERIARNEEEEEKRRALTPEEFQRLLFVSEERSLLYSVAVCSGLRKKELKLLAWGDVVTSGNGDTRLRLRSNTTKNRKAESVPVPRWCAEELLKSRPAAAVETTKVFPVLPRFYKDLKAAGIPAVDERGYKAVFHSFRHTLATWLFQYGANPKAIQGIMRHSTIELSANQYTNFHDSEYRDASNLLPVFEFGRYTQIRAQISVPEGQNVSQVGETKKKKFTSETLMDKGLGRLQTGVVAVGRMVRAAGFEPATPSV
ncbi:MAG: tyrosine-type recombinase/integrase [Armatimonadetes bacterium]|nr:tyrosine-type recombinase/integrase [Akkermansiaceae bacterium]